MVASGSKEQILVCSGRRKMVTCVCARVDQQAGNMYNSSVEAWTLLYLHVF